MNEPKLEVFDSSFFQLISPSSVCQLLWRGGKWCEGPVWLPVSQLLLWSDIPNNRVMQWSESQGVSLWLEPSRFANGHALDFLGRLLTCEHGSRSLTRKEANGSFTVLASHFNGKRLNSPNDLVIKSDGTIWFTDPPYGILSDYEGQKSFSELGQSYVFRLDPETGELAVVSDAFDKPNGLAFSPDEALLYIADTGFSHNPSGPHHIWVFDVVKGKNLTNGRLFAEINPGGPDGFRIDCTGHIFVAAWDGIQVYTPDAQLIGKIILPERAANCCFGGKDGNRLFITASTSLYAIDTLTKSFFPVTPVNCAQIQPPSTTKHC